MRVVSETRPDESRANEPPAIQTSAVQVMADQAERFSVRKWLFRAAAVLLLALVGLGGLLAYEYWNHPGRLTTAVEFSELQGAVVDNTLAWTGDHPIELAFDQRYRHAGGQKFILYGTADTEQHFFVEEHPDGSLKSAYWVQFESLLPDNDHTYDYSASPLREQVGPIEFYTDTAAGKAFPHWMEWPGTDGALARGYLADLGYHWPDHFAYARLVHLPDPGNRHEMLIIFIDDLAPTGMTSEELRPGGDHENRWPEIEGAHLDRVRQTMVPTLP